MSTLRPEEFVSVHSQPIERGADIHGLIERYFSNGKTANLFVVGAGGIQFLSQPAVDLLRTRSRVPIFYEMAAELVETDNIHLGPESLVVMPSLSGATEEAVNALEFARNKGAVTVTITGDAESALANKAHHTVTVKADDRTSSEIFYLIFLLFALAVLDVVDGDEYYNHAVPELRQLPTALVEARKAFEDEALRMAKGVADEQYILFTGAGNSWPEAHYYAMCILEEMQWIRTRPVHASDFFHGALEIVESDTTLVICKGEDEARPLADRVEAFATRITENVWTIDTASLPLPGLSDATRSLVSPVVLASMLELVSTHLETIREHPLTTRRYYKVMTY